MDEELKKLLEELFNELPILMFDYNTSYDGGSNYSCAFCGGNWENRTATLNHESDCLGKRLYDKLLSL